MAERSYSLDELAAESGVNARTLRSWVTSKVLPKPIGQGRGARYSANHLLRARVIAQLRQRGDSLQEIRSRIGPLTPTQLHALIMPPREGATPQTPSAPTYPFVNWQMVQLMPGLALMVQPKSSAAIQRIANEIYQQYSVPREV